MSARTVSKDHYERAVVDFLQSHSVPYLRVDEGKRSAFTGVKLKSFDLLIYPNSGDNIMVDVKGRKWPYQSKGGRRYWENWVTAADLRGLKNWEDVFGQSFRAGLLFCYWLTEAEDLACQAAYTISRAGNMDFCWYG